MDVVEDDFAVGVGVPVDAECDVVHDAARDIDVVQVEVRIAHGDFPRAFASLQAAVASYQEKVLERTNSIDRTGDAIVRTMFAGQEPADLNVFAVQ